MSGTSEELRLLLADAHQKVQQAESETRRYSEQLRMLAKASIAIGAELSVDVVTRTIAACAREIIGAEMAIVDTQAVGGALEVERGRCVRMTQAELVNAPALRELARRENPSVLLRGWLATPLAPLGKPYGVVHVANKLEGELSETDESILAQLAEVGSMAIARAMLVESEQAAIRERNDFVATVSHDLRNPLNGIILGASILRGQRDLPESDHDAVVLRIQRSAEKMNRLIGDLVDLTRIASGVFVVEPSAHLVERLVEEAVDAYRPIVANRGIALLQRVPPHLSVLADRPRVLQVLGGLIENAVKFTPSGGQITVGAEREGDFVKLFVADSGTGISDEELPHLFERSTQTPEGSTVGTGRALLIAKEIVSAHGSRIWVETGKRGTMVLFTLPPA